MHAVGENLRDGQAQGTEPGDPRLAQMHRSAGENEMGGVYIELKALRWLVDTLQAARCMVGGCSKPLCHSSARGLPVHPYTIFAGSE